MSTGSWLSSWCLTPSMCSVFCAELIHKHTLIRLQLPPFYFRATFPLQRAALVWLSSPCLGVCWWPALQPCHQGCPSVLLCPNALPQFSSHPSAISVLTSSLVRGDVPSAHRFIVLISNDHHLLTMISDSSACTGGRSQE